MCSRYSLTSPAEAVRAYFKYKNEAEFPPRYNIAPSQPVAIVRLDANAERELALVKVNATPGTRMEIMEIANVFRANVVDLTDRTMTLEVTGKGEKVDAIVSLLAKHGIREIARTGQATLVRGAQAT